MAQIKYMLLVTFTLLGLLILFKGEWGSDMPRSAGAAAIGAGR